MAKKPRAAPKKGGKAKSGGKVKAAKKVVTAAKDQHKGDVARQLLPAKDVKYLARFADEQKNKIGSITSTLGQEIKNYVEKGLDASAFQAALKQLRLGKRDPVRLRAFRDNLDYYLEVLEVAKLEAKDLFKDKPKASRAKKGDGEGAKVDTAQTDIEDFVSGEPAPMAAGAEVVGEDQQFH